jgi:hypothetical protein
MPSRIRDRLERLEAQLAPPRPARVFVCNIEDAPDFPSPAEQVAAFKAENGVTQHDHLITLAFV